MRIDGRAFHTFTRGFQKPFDKVLMNAMQETMKYLCENIQGCVYGYCQSDEITLVLIDYKELTSDCWFNYRTDKLCSIAASMATMRFNRVFLNFVDDYCQYDANATFAQRNIYIKAAEGGATFDCRCFNLPKEEVANCIYWRQLDVTRNSIQMIGQTNFSHKELHGKSCNTIKEMLLTQKNIVWEQLPTDCKRGAACIKKLKTEELPNKTIIEKSYWVIDKDMPIIKGENLKYINDLIMLDKD